MKPKNRLHTATRWPACPQKCLGLAILDLDYMRAISRCGIAINEDVSCRDIIREALRIEEWATRVIANRRAH
jgi:hypothetical protein